jgi:hypothetical protein
MHGQILGSCCWKKNSTSDPANTLIREQQKRPRFYGATVEKKTLPIRPTPEGLELESIPIDKKTSFFTARST